VLLLETNSKYELVKKAIQNDELNKLFLGQECYKWGNLKHIPADVPTDISAIIKVLYELYLTGYTNIPELLKDTIYQLAKGNAVDIWIAYYIVLIEYRNELQKKSPLWIIDEQIISAIKTTINDNIAMLSNCFDYVGKGEKQGLLSFIKRTNSHLESDFSKSILGDLS